MNADKLSRIGKNIESCITSNKVKIAVFAFLSILSRVAYFILTPIFLDYFETQNSELLENDTIITITTTGSFTNSTAENESNQVCSRSFSPFFVVFGQWVFTVVVCGSYLAFILIFQSHRIRKDIERSYPTRNFAFIGVCRGVSYIVVGYAISGSRTPPYLQGLLVNFLVPIQFVVRFIVLRKRPTLLKALCAVLVVLAEFMCLIPTIFPSLESAHAKEQSGGSTGSYKFLWPLLFVLSLIPYTVGTAVIEGGVKTQKISPATEAIVTVAEAEDESLSPPNTSDPDASADEPSDLPPSSSPSPAAPPSSPPPPSELPAPSSAKMDTAYFNFGWSVWVLLTTICLFWLNILPVFGTTKTITEFGCQFWLNVQCVFGAAGCGGKLVIAFAWLNFFSMFLQIASFSELVLYSEGANFAMMMMSLRTPVVFVFWTLFIEHPLGWHPHVSLSTWLCLGSIVIMVAAIILYDKAPSEVDLRAVKQGNVVNNEVALVAVQPSSIGESQTGNDEDVTVVQSPTNDANGNDSKVDVKPSSINESQTGNDEGVTVVQSPTDDANGNDRKDVTIVNDSIERTEQS